MRIAVAVTVHRATGLQRWHWQDIWKSSQLSRRANAASNAPCPVGLATAGHGAMLQGLDWCAVHQHKAQRLARFVELDMGDLNVGSAPIGRNNGAGGKAFALLRYLDDLAVAIAHHPSVGIGGDLNAFGHWLILSVAGTAPTAAH